MINKKLSKKSVAKILQRVNFNIIEILAINLNMLTRIFMTLKFVLYNILIANFFDYLLLIIFDNGYAIEKSNLDLVLSEKYLKKLFFLYICDLIPNDK